MIKEKKRKEVSLDEETLNLLTFQAKKEGRKLKNYMEHILFRKAHEFEVNDEYKRLMDEILLKKEKGDLELKDWDTVQNSLGI